MRSFIVHKSLVQVSSLVIAICLSIQTNALGFDGQRKGFIVGAGLGFSPSASWESEVTPFTAGSARFTIDESSSAAAAQFMIGYAVDNKNIIAFHNNLVSFSSRFFENDDIVQGISSISWFHYFRVAKHEVFLTAGFGPFIFDAGDAGQTESNEYGYVLGCGYEFARHFQIAAYYTSGDTEDANNHDLAHKHFALLISVLAY